MQSLVESYKKSAVQEMEMFLRNFSHVPDDKLDYKPTPTAKSALEVAAHTAVHAGRFASMINDRKLPEVDSLDDWLAKRKADEAAITTRAEMEKVFRNGTDEVMAALDSLTPEEIESSLDSGMGWSMSMRHVMGLPGWHATLHCGQIDYLQTCWDDQEIYVG